MTDRDQRLQTILTLIARFNKKDIVVDEATRFAQDLEWDSLTVMDFSSRERESDFVFLSHR